jgi:hypothetical protein
MKHPTTALLCCILEKFRELVGRKKMSREVGFVT